MAAGDKQSSRFRRRRNPRYTSLIVYMNARSTYDEIYGVIRHKQLIARLLILNPIRELTSEMSSPGFRGLLLHQLPYSIVLYSQVSG